MSDHFLRIEAWKKKFKSLLSTFSTNIKEEKKKTHSLFAQEEGRVMGGGVYQCVSAPEYLLSV